MVSFISVAFTYLAWIYTKKNDFSNAEKAFLHSIRIIKSVKSHTRQKMDEGSFIDTKTKKIFIYGNILIIYRSIN